MLRHLLNTENSRNLLLHLKTSPQQDVDMLRHLHRTRNSRNLLLCPETNLRPISTSQQTEIINLKPANRQRNRGRKKILRINLRLPVGESRLVQQMVQVKGKKKRMGGEDGGKIYKIIFFRSFAPQNL
jgi:hypothetical protein